MKPPQRTEAERIAGALTKAQRLAFERRGGATVTARRLFDKRLFASIHYQPGIGYAILHRLTQLGEDVAWYLSQEQTDER